MYWKRLAMSLGFCVYFVCVSHVVFAAKVGLCITAVGKYIAYVDPLIASAQKYFCPDHDVTFFVFTDSTLPQRAHVEYVYHPKLGWPFDSMMRFKCYVEHQQLFKDQDFVFAIDADALFVDVVGDEILGDSVATIHPGFFMNSRESFTYETDCRSRAYISPKEGSRYFVGAFYGGRRDEFVKLVSTNAKNIEADLECNLIAIWHDESHLNRYYVDHPPKVMLSPAYCCPEYWSLPFPRKILALLKDHSQMRGM